MEEIISNSLYEISVDRGKNRIYFTYRGKWESVSAVPDYYADIVKATARLKPGFTSLIDARDLLIPSEEVFRLFAKAQRYALRKGLRKSAHIIDNPEMHKASSRLARETGSNDVVRHFITTKEAEAWLDEPSEGRFSTSRHKKNAS